jgi:hypothetical protein
VRAFAFVLAENRRSETTLRADAELRQGKIPARRPDAPAQVIHALKSAFFSGDQAEQDEFVFGYVLERRKRARAIVVVFEQESLYLEPLEEPATDRFVTSLGEPPAALIAASEMERESDTRQSSDDRIVELDAGREPLLQTPPPTCPSRAKFEALFPAWARQFRFLECGTRRIPGTGSTHVNPHGQDLLSERPNHAG